MAEPQCTSSNRVEFEGLLIEHLKEFIHQESLYRQGGDHSTADLEEVLSLLSSDSVRGATMSKSFSDRSASVPPTECIDVIQIIQREMGDSVVHMLGETNVVAGPNVDLLKKIIVDYAYSFVRKSFRQP